MAQPYKPSPLSFTSPRTSPFRRPESPLSSTPSTVRATPPPYQANRPSTPSKLSSSASPSVPVSFSSPRAGRELLQTPSQPNVSKSSRHSTDDNDYKDSISTVEHTKITSPPFRNLNSFLERSVNDPKVSQGMDALSRLPAAQVREMREAFQILDRDSDGSVGSDDIKDMLGNLGLDPTQTATSGFFPSTSSSVISLPLFLSHLSSLLAPFSSPSELLAALTAFDDDDSGQIDVAELRDALANTRAEDGSATTILSHKDVEAVMEGFVGRRAFGSNSGGNRDRGNVFRYKEWVAGIGAFGGITLEGKETVVS